LSTDTKEGIVSDNPSYESLRSELISGNGTQALNLLDMAEATPYGENAFAYAAVGIGRVLTAINGNLERIADTLDEMSARQEEDL
jgi:hypothetical protein